MSSSLLDPKKLPKIMYDQTQFTPLYFVGKESLWLTDSVPKRLEEITGYGLDTWFLYTQKEPKSFFFGAYPEEVLEKEAQNGFTTFSNETFFQQFEEQQKVFYTHVSALRDRYFRDLYQNEKKALESDPMIVSQFIKDTHVLIAEIMAYYLHTQPQRLYEFERRLKTVDIPEDEKELLSTNGRSFTFISKLRYALVHVAKFMHEHKLTFSGLKEYHPNVWKEHKDAVEQYGFLSWGLFGGDHVSETTLETVVENLKQGTELHKEHEQLVTIERNMQARKGILEEKPSEAHCLADVIGHVGVIRFNLQTYILCLLKYIDNILVALAETHGMSKEDLDVYEYHDLLRLIETKEKLSEAVAAIRRQGILKYFSNGVPEHFYGKEAGEKIAELLEFREKEMKGLSEVKGAVASKPKDGIMEFTARAFVLTSSFGAEKTLESFQDGDLLIATQTHPNLVPYMKRARAIVTDEGGVTCHAAIVSRELGKPCIIGTRLATKIFMTGENLVLDMKQGVVRKNSQ